MRGADKEDTIVPQARFRGTCSSRNVGPVDDLSQLRLRPVVGAAYQRKKPAAIGVKAPYPGFIEPALATSIEKLPPGERWIPGLDPGVSPPGYQV